MWTRFNEIVFNIPNNGLSSTANADKKITINFEKWVYSEQLDTTSMTKKWLFRTSRETQ
jgi:hypothetical protein